MMANIEKRVCQNCKKGFMIEPDDFGFYEKIKVPPPTFCPDCRMIRRMSCRNLRNFYRGKCNAPGHSENIISVYSSDKKNKVYDHKYWWSGEWNLFNYGIEYNFLKTFFEQFFELYHSFPQLNFSNVMAVNSEYCNMTIKSKNCYFLFSGNESENCMFSESLIKMKDCCDILIGYKSELCYESINCNNSFKLIFSLDCNNCVDSAFLTDCNNCQNCFGCWNLRNKKYMIFNQQYIKDEYYKITSGLFSGKYSEIVIIKNKLKKEAKPIKRYSQIIHSQNVTGDDILNSKNCFSCFDIRNSEDSKNIWRILGGGAINHDITVAVKPELGYEGSGIGNSYNSLMCVALDSGKYLTYCQYCLSNCSNCFGCVGLRNKSYCILNKQYTKEQYEKVVPKIIKHMNDMPYVDKKGRIYKYGEFFPSELSPFCYNETIAQEYFPLTKEQALEQGYKWKDREERNYEIEIKNKDIPDDIKDVKDDIVGKIIECEHKGKCNEQCTEALKIIENELQFYRRMNLPLPHLCPNYRHYQRLKQRNPLKLWHRTCMCDKTNHYNHKGSCDVEFETSYAPDRPEIIYCEKCYQQEIY